MAELILIGSGCGVPSKNYGPPCFAVKDKENTFIVDMGYDSLQKILKYVDVNKVENIFISHTHPDHFWGVIPFCFYVKCLYKNYPKKTINVYGHENVGSFLSFINGFYKWFSRKPDVNFVDVNKNDRRKAKGILYNAIKTNHSEDSLAYKFVIQNKSIVFTGDTEYSKELVNFCKDAYILVCECSYVKAGEGHMDIDSFKRFFFETGAEKIVLVHNYREEGYKLALRELKKELKESLIIGKDGLVLNF